MYSLGNQSTQTAVVSQKLNALKVVISQKGSLRGDQVAFLTEETLHWGRRWQGGVVF